MVAVTRGCSATAERETITPATKITPIRTANKRRRFETQCIVVIKRSSIPMLKFRAVFPSSISVAEIRTYEWLPPV
jgi:hypothetical protein